ncbi:MAG: hypothetical protein IIA67_00900 [Planctomycetes bacterium]|nr:hypothetical protein [Planctomycetota bacterium]
MKLRTEKTIEEHRRFVLIRGDGTPSIVNREDIDLEAACDATLCIDLDGARATFRRAVGERTKFTNAQAQQAALISYRQILHWADRGLLTPDAVLPGGRRVWGLDAVFACTIIGALRRASQPLPVIAAVLDLLRPENAEVLEAESEKVKV